MKKIKLVDNAFSHGKTTTDIQICKHIEWDRSTSQDNEIVIVTDNSLFRSDNIKGDKIGLVIEPRSINNNLYGWLGINQNKFKNILTYDKDLLEICKNSIFYPHGGCWINPKDQVLWEKRKLLSIISSEKNFTVGHKMRHNVIKILKENNISFDLYGRGYNPIENKIDGLKDYKFSIIIENSKYDYYFTEKIIDCFRTGVIPIYWGCPSIGKFFDELGIISFNNEEDLFEIVKNLNDSDYQNRIKHVQKNYELSNEYLLIENWIYENTNIF